MNDKKFIYQKETVTIAIGNTSYSNQIQLERGICRGVKVVDCSLAASTKANEINLNITSSDGSRIIGETDFRDFIANGGGYQEGLKPVLFNTASRVNVAVTSSAAIAGTDLVIQVIFQIEVPA